MRKSRIPYLQETTTCECDIRVRSHCGLDHLPCHHNNTGAGASLDAFSGMYTSIAMDTPSTSLNTSSIGLGTSYDDVERVDIV